MLLVCESGVWPATSQLLLQPAKPEKRMQGMDRRFHETAYCEAARDDQAPGRVSPVHRQVAQIESRSGPALLPAYGPGVSTPVENTLWLFGS